MIQHFRFLFRFMQNLYFLNFVRACVRESFLRIFHMTECSICYWTWFLQAVLYSYDCVHGCMCFYVCVRAWVVCSWDVQASAGCVCMCLYMLQFVFIFLKARYIIQHIISIFIIFFYEETWCCCCIRVSVYLNNISCKTQYFSK